MAKRVLISRPVGTDAERHEANRVDFEVQSRQAGIAPTYTPTSETQEIREKIKHYRSISQLTPQELLELAIKYHNQ